MILEIQKYSLDEPILIVDDEEEIRQILGELAAGFGLTPLFTSSAAEALDLLKKKSNSPCLVLSDFKMPGLTGVQFCSEFKKKFPDISFVLITGHADKAMAIASLDVGVNGLIEKPFDLELVEQTIKKHLDQRIRAIHAEENELEEIAHCFIEEATELLGDLDKLILRLEKEPVDPIVVDLLFRKMHSIKGGAAAFPRGKLLSALAHEFETVLSLVKKSDISLGHFGTDAFLQTADLCRTLIGYIEKRHALPTELKSRTLAQIDELIKLGKSGTTRTEVKANPISEPKVSRIEPALNASEAESQDDDAILVPKEKLDSFMKLSGEFVVARNTFEGISKDPSFFAQPEKTLRRLKDFFYSFNRLTDHLQGQIMSVRKVSLDKALNKIPRVVRQVSTEVGKKVRFEITGGDLGVDRTIAKALSASIVHIVRNSIDHGIEAPEQRLKLGKPLEGLIAISASEQKGMISISISDDGAGINRDKVLSRALKNGLISEDDAQKLSNEEINELLFLPGFSTADQVSDISGRGVGMDVVKSSVVGLGGKLKIQSKPDLGMSIQLEIPVPKSVMVGKTILVQSDQTFIAVPQTAISRIVRFNQENVTMINKKKTVQFEEKTVYVGSYQDLADFQRGGSDRSSLNVPKYIVFVHHKQNRIGLLVSDICGQLEAVIRPFDEVIHTVPGFKGTTMFGDDQIAYVISEEQISSGISMLPADK